MASLYEPASQSICAVDEHEAIVKALRACDLTAAIDLSWHHFLPMERRIASNLSPKPRRNLPKSSGSGGTAGTLNHCSRIPVRLRRRSAGRLIGADLEVQSNSGRRLVRTTPRHDISQCGIETYQSDTTAPTVQPQAKPGFFATFRHHKWQWVLTLLVVVLAVLPGARLVLRPEVVVPRVSKGDLVKTVVASGHVETPFRVEIAAQVTGAVANVLVDEGQTVKAGQPLIALDATELTSTVVQTEGALAQAQARLKQLRELTLPQAQEALKQAQATFANAEAAFGR
eukprot:gene24109-25789_t